MFVFKYLVFLWGCFAVSVGGYALVMGSSDFENQSGMKLYTAVGAMALLGSGSMIFAELRDFGLFDRFYPLEKSESADLQFPRADSKSSFELSSDTVRSEIVNRLLTDILVRALHMHSCRSTRDVAECLRTTRSLNGNRPEARAIIRAIEILHMDLLSTDPNSRAVTPPIQSDPQFAQLLTQVQNGQVTQSQVLQLVQRFVRHR